MGSSLAEHRTSLLRRTHSLSLRRVIDPVDCILGLVQLRILGCRGSVHVLVSRGLLAVEILARLHGIGSPTPETRYSSEHICLHWCTFCVVFVAL